MKQKHQVSVSFMIAGIVFCTCLVAANLLETKVFRAWGPISLTCGFLVFPISYILNDVIAEVWGYRKARLIIWMGFLMNFLVVALGGIACALPAAVEGSDEAFKQVFAFAPQVAVASLLAFIVGSFLNALVMSKMKMADRNKGHFSYHFSMRAILSTVFGEGVDSIIFFPLALGGVIPWEEMPSLMISQVTLKTLYEILVLPVTIRVVEYTKKRDHEDVYDEDINYNIFNILKI